MKSLIARVGGKSRLKKRLVDYYFPDNYEIMTYVEPFVGGGSIFFYKEPSQKEVINDLDSDVIKIYRGFKKYDGNKIEEDINGAYSKETFNNIKASNPTTEYGKFIRLLKLIKLSFFGFGKTFGNTFSINSRYKDDYSNRLKNTTILNEDYKKVIKTYDSPNTFFYLDPPYEESEGLYKNDVLPIQEVYDIVKNIKGKFLISYNNSKEAKELFKNYKISYIKTKYVDPQEGGSATRTKTEMIISNY
jgi:DNA adenine methylase